MRLEIGTGFLVCHRFERIYSRYSSVGLVDPATMNERGEGTLLELRVPEELEDKYVALGYTVLEQPTAPQRNPPLAVGIEDLLGRGTLFCRKNGEIGLLPHLGQKYLLLNEAVVRKGLWHRVVLWAECSDSDQPDFRINQFNLERLEAMLKILGVETGPSIATRDRVKRSPVWKKLLEVDAQNFEFGQPNRVDDGDVAAAFYSARRCGLSPEEAAQMVLNEFPGGTREDREGALSEIEEPIDDPVPPRRYHKRPGQ